MLGGGVTVTATEALLVVSASEVAVMVMLRLAETVDGAVYVAVVVVALLKTPHSVPVTPVPDALHVTPLVLVSFTSRTFAVKGVEER